MKSGQSVSLNGTTESSEAWLIITTNKIENIIHRAIIPGL